MFNDEGHDDVWELHPISIPFETGRYTYTLCLISRVWGRLLLATQENHVYCKHLSTDADIVSILIYWFVLICYMISITVYNSCAEAPMQEPPWPWARCENGHNVMQEVVKSADLNRISLAVVSGCKWNSHYTPPPPVYTRIPCLAIVTVISD